MAKPKDYKDINGPVFTNNDGEHYKIVSATSDNGTVGVWHVYYNGNKTFVAGGATADEVLARNAQRAAAAQQAAQDASDAARAAGAAGGASAPAPGPGPAPAPAASNPPIGETNGQMQVNTTSNERQGQQYVVELGTIERNGQIISGRYHVYLDGKGNETRRIFLPGPPPASDNVQNAAPQKGLGSVPLGPATAAGGTAAPTPEEIQRATDFRDAQERQALEYINQTYPRTDEMPGPHHGWRYRITDDSATRGDTHGQIREYIEPGTGELSSVFIPAPQKGLESAQSNGPNIITGQGNTNSAASNTYTVVRGDSMSAIADRNDMSLAQLRALNPQITNPNVIHPGQKINLGSGGTLVADSSNGFLTSSVYPPSSGGPQAGSGPGRSDGWVGGAAGATDPANIAFGGTGTTNTDPTKIKEDKSSTGGGEG